MVRAAGILAVTLLCAGCTNTFSRCLVVRSPAGPEARLQPGDVVDPGHPDFAPPAPDPSPKPLPDPARTRWWTYEPGAALSEAERMACRKRCCLTRARRKSNLLAGGTVGAMVAYGFAYFGFGSADFHTHDDGWFARGSNSGGADKLGHAFGAHVLTCALAAINRRWGIPRQEAAIRGAAAAWTTMFAMELGDGISEEFGFSWPDVAANTAGALFGYLHASNPRFAEVFDYRWEYWPSDSARETGENEYTTDYEGSAYVLAANLGAIRGRRRNALDFFDAQVGWKTRHYVDRAAPTEQILFVGIGVNLQTVCERLGMRHLAKVFQFYQPPGISLRWETDVND